MPRPGESGNPLVLVADDDDDLRLAIADALTIEGYRTWTACDGIEVLERLDAARELPCAILLDLMMPRMSGQQLLERLRGEPRFAAIAVIVVTASTHIAVTGLAADAVLRKPVGIDRLLETLGSVCRD